MCRLLLLILCMFIVHVMYYKLPVADLRHAEVVHLYVKPYDRRVLCYYIIYSAGCVRGCVRIPLLFRCL